MLKKMETISEPIRRLQTRVDREATKRLYRRKYMYLILSGAPEQNSGTADERRTADAELVEAVADAVGVRDLIIADRCFEDRTVALRKTNTIAF